MNVTVCVDCVAVVLLVRTAGRDSCIWAELRGGFVFCFLAFSQLPNGAFRSLLRLNFGLSFWFSSNL
jgi:hypothetical protein